MRWLPIILLLATAASTISCDDDDCDDGATCAPRTDAGPVCVMPSTADDHVACGAEAPCCSGYVCSLALGYCIGCPTDGRPCVERPPDAGADTGP